MTLLNQLQWRAAVKQYSDKKVSQEDIEQLKKSLQLAPSSFGLQPYMFILVENKEVRAKLQEAGYNQPAITEASHLFVLASQTNPTAVNIDSFIDLNVKVRGGSKEDLAEYAGMMKGFYQSKSQEELQLWASRQTYITLGFLLSAAAQMNIDATPMEGFDPAKVDEILGLGDKGYTASVIVPVGYRSEEDKYSQMDKVRKPLDKMFEVVA